VSTVGDILPSNKDTFEEALADAMSDELPVPFIDLMDPAETRADMLPWLAAHESVDLWFPDWAEVRKRDMIADAPALARLVGTRAAAQRFLDYVDADIIHKVSYPQRFPVGRIAVRITPINHPEFVARFLIKVTLMARKNAVCALRTAVGLAHLKPIDTTVIKRTKIALSLSKADDTEYSVNFAHRLPITMDDPDALDLDTDYVLGSYKDRIRL